MGRHICIIGGSGFVGRAIVDQAVRRGIRSQWPAGTRSARNLLVKGARMVRVDVVDGRGLDEAVAGAEVVIYLVGLLYERGATASRRHTWMAWNVCWPPASVPE